MRTGRRASSCDDTPGGPHAGRRSASARSTLADVGRPVQRRALVDTYHDATAGRRGASYDGCDAHADHDARPRAGRRRRPTTPRAIPAALTPGAGVAPRTYECDDAAGCQASPRAGAPTRSPTTPATGRTCALDGGAAAPDLPTTTSTASSPIKRPAAARNATSTTPRATAPRASSPAASATCSGATPAARWTAYAPRRARADARHTTADCRLDAPPARRRRTTYARQRARDRRRLGDAAVEYGYDGAADRPASMTRTATARRRRGLRVRLRRRADDRHHRHRHRRGRVHVRLRRDGFLASIKLVAARRRSPRAHARQRRPRDRLRAVRDRARAAPAATATAITGGGLAMALEPRRRRRAARDARSPSGRHSATRTRSRATTPAGSPRATRRSTAAHHDVRLRVRPRRASCTSVERRRDRRSRPTPTTRTATGAGAHAVETATYDDDDRMTRHDRVYDAAGFLVSRGADTFDYTDRGELQSATVGGATVDYELRRVGPARRPRHGRCGSTQFLYGDSGQPVPRHRDAAPAGALTQYFYDDDGMLYAFERGGARYYVGTDQVGTPRVVAAADGAVVRTCATRRVRRPGQRRQPARSSCRSASRAACEDPVTGLVRFGMRDYEPAAGPLDRARPRALRRRPGQPVRVRRQQPGNAARPDRAVVRRRVDVRRGRRRRDRLRHRQGLRRSAPRSASASAGRSAWITASCRRTARRSSPRRRPTSRASGSGSARS